MGCLLLLVGFLLVGSPSPDTHIVGLVLIVMGIFWPSDHKDD